MPNVDPNVAEVARRLGELRNEVVFLGGAIVGTLITDDAAPAVRPTDDVDFIVEVASRMRYAQFERALEAKGFRHDPDPDAPICRWVLDEIKVDVMPTDEKILGFANRWAREAMQHSVELEIEPGISLRHVSAPYFLATKVEAFAHRGNGDLRASPDIEDVVAVIDGRPTLLEEIRRESNAELESFLAAAINAWGARGLADAVPGHLPADTASQQRVPAVLKFFRTVAAFTAPKGT